MAPPIELRDPLLDLVLILVAAKLAGEAATRLGQPAVLGELLVGIALGPSLLNPFARAGVVVSLAAAPGRPGPRDLRRHRRAAPPLDPRAPRARGGRLGLRDP